MTAAKRWRGLVRRRLAEMERLQPGRGGVGAQFWNERGRAGRYAATVGAVAEEDPLLARLRTAAPRDGVLLDVGAGTGRFTLALAPEVGRVVAVDPSRSMLAVLRRRVRERGLDNVQVVERAWQDVPAGVDAGGGADAVPLADVVLCSYVLPLIADAAAFLERMDAACRGRAFVYMNAFSADALVDPFWRHFHDRPRSPAPTYLDAVAILRELGFDPMVEIVEPRPMTRFDTLAKAVASYREQLLVPDTAEVRAELRSLLAPWLARDDDGRLRPPVRTVPAAIISWQGRHARKPTRRRTARRAGER